MNRTLDLCSQGVAAPLSQAEDVEIRRHTRNCFRIVRRILDAVRSPSRMRIQRLVVDHRS
jgi:hypothetical protein